MVRLQLRMRTLPRGEPLDDQAEGLRLVELVTQSVERGGAPLVGVVLRGDRLDILGLEVLKEARVGLNWLLAGMTASEQEGVGPVEAVGLMGIVRVRTSPTPPGEPPPPAVPMAIAFLEWEDCRWWFWRAPIDVNQERVLTDTQVITRAEDGDPLPNQLGRWWSLARRRRMRLRLDGPEPLAEPSSPLVH